MGESRGRAVGLADALDGVVRVGATPVLRHVTTAVRELLGANASLAVGISEAEGGWSVDFGEYASRSANDEFLPRFTDFIADQPSVWAYWNPARPEPAQRNVVKTIEWRNLVDLPIAQTAFKGTEAHGCDQLRVLICDGASLLAWLGVMRSTPYAEDDVQLLEELVAPLQRRLALERKLGDPRDTAALIACLELLGGAAFVVASGGHVRHANVAGRQRLDRAPRETLASVRAALRGGSADFRVVPVAAEGWPAYSLVIEQPGDALTAKIKEVARAFALTPRQCEVVARVARGEANKTIAAELNCSVRNVEAHLATVFGKLGVDSRAALVSRVWSV